jgi:uncharacterized membrane protein
MWPAKWFIQFLPDSTMKLVQKVFADTVFVIQILIIFILIFENSIAVPPLLQAFGRMHPLLLHLPIGLFLVTVILIFARRFFEGTSFDDLISFLLHLTALTASLTTLMGLMLSLEGTFASDQLRAHKWLGVALSFLCWSLLLLRDNVKILKAVSVAGTLLLVFTGHYGATLTHGDDFVLAPLQTDEVRTTRIITDSTTLFTATIEPILESKCYGCHNSKKAKGKLILTSLEDIAKGGKNGDLWKPHDASSSLIVERITLPLEEKEHMPPKDKTQLTADEVQFISLWIDAGANTEQKLGEVPQTDTLRQLADIIVPRYQQPAEAKAQYSFEFASAGKIEKLSTPNRTVFQIAKNEPAVQADFYLRETFQPKYLEELVEVKDQLVSVNLSNMPVKDADLKTIARFENLEVLNLNNTDIKGEGLKALTSLDKLQSVSVSGTRVPAQRLADLASSKSLKEVFVWNTGVTTEDLKVLSDQFPQISWSIGYVPDTTEVLTLNVPLLKSDNRVLEADQKIVLKHNLPGTVVRYTTDGSQPDSIKSPVYKDPIQMEGAFLLKTKAYKDGWHSSDVAEFFMFKKGSTPTTFNLLTKPDDTYPGEGSITLINGLKGIPDFYRHPAWMGFRNNDLVVDFAFDDNAPPLKSVTLSYAKNAGAICMPPQEMQVWAGNEKDKLTLVAKTNPRQPEGYDPIRIEGATVTLPATRFKYYKLVAKPLAKLPAFRNNKKAKGWLMVDEIFFN